MEKNKINLIVFLLLITSFVSYGQSLMLFEKGSTIEVSGSADICADIITINGSYSGNGTKCNAPLPVELDSKSEIPTNFLVYQNYPNPFNPTTVISYDIPKTSFVVINVYDLLGKEVKTLVSEEKFPGKYQMILDGKNIPSGIYYYRIQAGDFTQTKKMILMK